MNGELLKNQKICCAFCKGSGTQSPSGLLENKCAVCDGKGFQHFRLAAFCAYCRGEGRGILNRSLPCASCRGAGAAEFPKSFATCDKCEGRGNQPTTYLACTGCRGKGINEIKEA